MIRKNQKGITLIALVITIIVLIILASVSIAMLTGENGILKKATTAKEKTIEAEDEEKIQLAVLASRDNNGDFSKDLLKEELKKYGLNGEDDDNGSTTVTVNGKTYTIDDEGKVTSKETIKDITAKMVADHPETYYGLKVTNYTSTNGQDDWRIFYSDGTHIFLITGDYVDLSVANRLDSNTGMTKEGTKTAYWEDSDVPSNLQVVDNAVKTRFKSTGYTLNNNNDNSKCVSALLNTSNWESYKDNNGMAEYAIGGSTIEMWMDSWNKKYPNDKLYCNNTNSYGYYVGINSDDSENSVETWDKEGYNNSLYYPHKDSVSNPNASQDCISYWIASTSAEDEWGLLCVVYNGTIRRSYLGDMDLALRPLVSLKSGVTVNATDVQ